MRVWIEVIQELIDFVLGRETTTDSATRGAPASEPTTIAHTPTPPHESLVAVPEVPADLPISTTQETYRKPETFTHTIEPERMYIGIEREPCYKRPVRALDSIMTELTYGTPVTVGRLEGRWAHVETEGVDGWVLKDSVVSDKDLVYPQLEEGIVYEANHPETVKLRMLIHDMFAAGPLTLPLQDIEYVTYRLQENGRIISWPETRPRTAGRWQQILRGHTGIHVGINPVKHAIMETVFEDGLGLVEYVEAVHPDESVLVSGIDSQIPGRYRTRTLSKAEWIEAQPVFIEVTTGI